MVFPGYKKLYLEISVSGKYKSVLEIPVLK